MNIKDNEIKVSILCAVYNHEKYLRRCLDGFVNQKTNFKYEALIHDDCSTDKSKSIIEEYYKKYPDIIVPIYEDENQYSKGIKINIDILMPRMRGKYFALCEGDDYWIDENKLQKQFDFMEVNQEYSLCVHNADIVDTDGKKISNISPVKESRDLSCEEFILGGGGFIATNSIFAPSYLTKKLPSFFSDFTVDYIWQIYLSSQGKTYCINENLSAYRKGVEGSWTQRMSKEKNKKIIFFEKVINALFQFDIYTEKKYHESIEKMMLVYKIKIYELKDDYKSILKKPYKNLISKKEKNKYFIKAYMSRLYKIYNRLKNKKEV